MGWDALPRIKLTREQKEERRLAAARDLRAGVSQAEIARRYGVSRTSAHRWAKAVDRGGVDALRRKRGGGRPPELDEAQLKRLARVLEAGALAYGYSNDLWTTRRVADVVWKEFRVRYHRNHVGRVLKRMGWTYHKPQRVAREKDEAKKRAWLRSAWTRVKKN